MSDRIRINLSVRPSVYKRLKEIGRVRRFASVCSQVIALINLYIDMVDANGTIPQGMEEDDGEYLRRMFSELQDTTPVPDGTVPVRHPNKRRL